MATLERPFLTIETGEAYQPIRLSYKIEQDEQLLDLLNQLQCCKKNKQSTIWDWFWRDECAELHFESLDNYSKNNAHPARLGTLIIRENLLSIHLPSFKRACLAIPFFHRLIHPYAQIRHADFINKVFGIDERLPHGLNSIFNDEELETHIIQRMHEYDQIQIQCENAANAEEAFKILARYSKIEAQKKLPYTERYLFQHEENEELDVIYLGFYIFLRGRELVAIRRFQGDSQFTLANAAEESLEKVFGGMDIDIIE